MERFKKSQRRRNGADDGFGNVDERRDFKPSFEAGQARKPKFEAELPPQWHGHIEIVSRYHDADEIRVMREALERMAQSDVSLLGCIARVWRNSKRDDYLVVLRYAIPKSLVAKVGKAFGAALQWHGPIAVAAFDPDPGELFGGKILHIVEGRWQAHGLGGGYTREGFDDPQDAPDDGLARIAAILEALSPEDRLL